MSDTCTILDDILGRRGGEGSHNAARRVVAERDQLRQELAAHADPYSEQNQAASAWKAISTHPLIGDLPSLPERGTYADSVRARLDEIAASSSLPEPDDTNPDHWRFAANLIPGEWRLRSGDRAISSIFNEEADRLDAARSAEREREQRVEQFISILADCGVVAHTSTGLDNLRQAGEKLMSAGLLRGGGRGE